MRKAICENGGCSSKLSGNELVAMIRNARRISGDDIDSESVKSSFDDCAIVNFDSNKLLFTTDQNPPIGHDPYIAGKIAALHAASDVYAMGGKPLYALASIVLGKETTEEQSEKFLAGLLDACKEESISLVGGHTIISIEPLIGLSVIGVPKEHVYAKRKCRVGDKIYVSKPIGTGMVLRGYYNGLLEDADLDEALSVMTISNRVALSIVDDHSINALTDITGFGLLGHLSEMLSSEQGVNLNMENIPFLNSINKLPALQMKSKFIDGNIAYVRKSKRIGFSIDAPERLALFDPQTNGALLTVASGAKSSMLIDNGFVCIGDISNSNIISLQG